MDAFYVNRALKKLGEFERCNVGLVSVSVDGAVTLHHRPRYRSPSGPSNASSPRELYSPVTPSVRSSSEGPPQERRVRSRAGN
jgi:hypothetical protein